MNTPNPSENRAVSYKAPDDRFLKSIKKELYRVFRDHVLNGNMNLDGEAYNELVAAMDQCVMLPEGEDLTFHNAEGELKIQIPLDVNPATLLKKFSELVTEGSDDSSTYVEIMSVLGNKF